MVATRKTNSHSANNSGRFYIGNFSEPGNVVLPKQASLSSAGEKAQSSISASRQLKTGIASKTEIPPTEGMNKGEAASQTITIRGDSIDASTDFNTVDVNQNSYAPQHIPVNAKEFVIHTALQGEAGTIIQAGTLLAGQGLNELFYSPKDSAAKFYKLHTVGYHSLTNATVVAGSPQDRNYIYITKRGLLAKLALHRKEFLDDIMSSFKVRLQDGRAAIWRSLPRQNIEKIQSQIVTGEHKLFSLPLDHRPEFAVDITSYERGPARLVVTVPTYGDVRNLRAYVIPHDPVTVPRQLGILSAFQFSDSGTLWLTLRTKSHSYDVMASEDPYVSIDGKKVKRLPPEALKRMSANNRIPGVPKTPTVLVTPFMDFLKGGPV